MRQEVRRLRQQLQKVVKALERRVKNCVVCGDGLSMPRPLIPCSAGCDDDARLLDEIAPGWREGTM